ncbi:MAG: hypothetical protein H8E57_00770 [Candidatus Cloacimonetes bacterium]|nr:hypothetical protein [Candidatus Cloacimonadota bacterium]
MSHKIKRDYSRIVDEIGKVNVQIVHTIIRLVFTDKELHDLSIGDFKMSISLLASIINFKEKKINYVFYLKKIIAKNNLKLKGIIDTSMKPDEIEAARNSNAKDNPFMKKDDSYHLIFLYFLSSNIFRGETIDYLKEKCRTSLIQSIKIGNKILKEIDDGLYKLADNLDNSKAEFILNSMVQEDEISKNIFKMLKPQLMAKEYACAYDSKRKVFNNVKRGFLYFIKFQFIQLLTAQQKAFKQTQNAVAVSESLHEESRRLTILRESYYKDKDKLLQIKKAKKALKKENKRLNEKVLKKIDKSSNTELENRVHNLQKENNYHLSRIEKMEEQIAILEEEKKLNKELAENIIIEEEKEKKAIELPEYQNIVIMGGRWTSNNRKDVVNYLPDNDIEFIDADKTLRHFDRIANADIIFFDTSYNSHSYYYRAKKCHNDFYHINNSNLHEIKKIFEN